MNTFPTIEDAEARALRDWRCGFMSESKKTIYRNGLGEYVLVGDPCYASGPIVSMVVGGKVSRS